jgi:glycosyltransferase involved in cell wall biosynthesis
MQIGLLTTSYPRHRRDPAGRFVAELAGWLAGAGDAVEVIAPHPARSEHPGVAVHAVRYALRPRLLYRAGAPDNLVAPTTWPQIPAFVGRLAAATLRRRRRWDALLSHWLLPSGLVGSLAARHLRHVCVVHSSDAHLIRRLGSPRLLELALGSCTQLVLTSESLRPLLLSVAVGPRARVRVERAPVVRMGVHPPAELSPEVPLALRRQHGHEGRFVVLYVGRLVPVKGVDVLIRACAEIEGAVLVLLGDGPERAQLRALADRLGGRVLFRGPVGPAERDRWLAAADLLALPSVVLADGRTDSAPLALLEAMAAGLPVVATRAGGNAELVTDGRSGLLVPPGDPAALRHAITRLLEDAEYRGQLALGAQHAARIHTWDAVGARIRRLLATSSPPGT